MTSIKYSHVLLLMCTCDNTIGNKLTVTVFVHIGSYVNQMLGRW